MAMGQPACISSITKSDQVIQTGLVISDLFFTAEHKTSEVFVDYFPQLLLQSF